MTQQHHKTNPVHQSKSPDTTWDLESIFPSVDAWEAEYRAVSKELPALRSFEGRVMESADTLHEYLKQAFGLEERADKLYAYAAEVLCRYK